MGNKKRGIKSRAFVSSKRKATHNAFKYAPDKSTAWITSHTSMRHKIKHLCEKLSRWSTRILHPRAVQGTRYWHASPRWTDSGSKWDYCPPAKAQIQYINPANQNNLAINGTMEQNSQMFDECWDRRKCPLPGPPFVQKITLSVAGFPSDSKYI